MDKTVFAVISGGSFIGSTVLTNTSTLANSDGFPSFSYLQDNEKLKLKFLTIITTMCLCVRERERDTSMIIYLDMFLAQLDTTLETDLISKIRQTIFHKLLM
jgi:hypothetical protein